MESGCNGRHCRKCSPSLSTGTYLYYAGCTNDCYTSTPIDSTGPYVLQGLLPTSILLVSVITVLTVFCLFLDQNESNQ